MSLATPARSFAALAALVLGALLSTSTALGEPSSVRWDTSVEVSGYYDSDHVAVLTPALRAAAHDPTRGWSANGGYLVDIVSAASVDIVSAASPGWTEVRQAADLSVGYKPRALGISLTGASSLEPDYFSVSGGVVATGDFDRKNATLSLSYNYEHNIAGRSGTPFSVYALRLDRHDFGARAELVVDRATTLTPAVDVMLESGRQEKPYRFLPLFDASVASSIDVGASVDEVNQLRLPGRVSERVPDARQRYAASARLAHRFTDSTLLVWDRVYLDSWGMLASTTDLRWVMSLSRRWSIWPHARFHAQSGVSFWQRAYVGSVGGGSVEVPEYRTGDRELSPLWSGTLGPGVEWDLGAIDPRSMSLKLEVEGTYADFRDALYIDHRWAGFGVASFAVRLP